MDFPIYQFPYLGNGMVIGTNAVIHVLLSHGLAIGLFTFIVLCEYIGVKKNSEEWENFAKRLIKPTVIIITGVSSLTGVGIWFTTNSLSPTGIGSMLRVFFWPWFLEWIVFTLEVIGLLIYYFTWDSWKNKKKKHIMLGFSYTVLGVISAFFITGILGFMLTSNVWPWDKSFSSAFYNPTFLPQLIFRLAMGTFLGVVFLITYLLFSKKNGNEFKREVLSLFGKIGLVSLIICVVTIWWYIQEIPMTFQVHSITAVLTSHLAQTPWVFWVTNFVGIGLLFLFTFLSIGKSTMMMKLLTIIVLIFSFAFVTEFERIREFIRGPYLMPGYMYANQVLLQEKPHFDKEGMLQNSYWYNNTIDKPDLIKQGTYLFFKNCSSCHTINGLNDIADRVRGRSEDGIYVLIGHTQDIGPFMPPFAGTDKERRTMASFLYELSLGKYKPQSLSRFKLTERGDK